MAAGLTLDCGSNGAKAPALPKARADSSRPGSPSPRTPNCEDWAATPAGSTPSSTMSTKGRTYGLENGKRGRKFTRIRGGAPERDEPKTARVNVSTSGV